MVIIKNQKARGTPAGPYSSTEILNFEESADGHNGGERMEAKVFTVSPWKGGKPLVPPISRSGGRAEGTVPPRTRAV